MIYSSSPHTSLSLSRFLSSDPLYILNQDHRIDRTNTKNTRNPQNLPPKNSERQPTREEREKKETRDRERERERNNDVSRITYYFNDIRKN
jgi:hypothetical protein